MAWTNEQVVYNADGTRKAEQPEDTSNYVLLEGETLRSAGAQDALTADAVNAEAWNDSELEAQRKTEADEAGVQDARHIGYAEVLENYNRRSDTEPLADRRARALATDPGQQSFTRAAEYTGNSVEDETDYPTDGEWTEDTFPPVTP